MYISDIINLLFLSKRAGTRRHYHDDGISDEEIEGRRTFDLEEKVNSQRFTSELVNHMEGKGQTQLMLFYTGMNESCVAAENCCMGKNHHVVVFLLVFRLDFTYEFIQRSGLREPIIFEKPDGLGIK